MKIVIAGTAYPMRGGIAQFNALLYKYFSESNEVKIFSFKRQYPEFLFPGKTQYETDEPDFRIPEDKNIICLDSINPLNWISTGFKIAKENADLLVFKYWIPFFAPCFAVVSFIVKKKSNAKVLFICDNVIPHEKRLGDKIFTKLAFSQADYFVVMSRIVEDDLKKFNKSKPYKLIPHPVYNIFGEKVSKDTAREFLMNQYKVDVRKDRVILFFGYVRKYKGLIYLIEAMKEIVERADVKLLIAGEFYEDESITINKIKELNLEKNIFLFSDFISNDKVKYFFCASDVVVLPYIDATQSGITQIAYFYDKPVIATDVGGLKETVIDNETGLIIEPKSSKAIAKAVFDFYENNLEEKLSIRAAEEKKRYTWEGFTGEIIEMVNQKT